MGEKKMEIVVLMSVQKPIGEAKVAKTRKWQIRIRNRALLTGLVVGLITIMQLRAAESFKTAKAAKHWYFPAAHDVQLGGTLGEAYHRSVDRLAEDPYQSVAFLRADVSFEMKRIFTEYSGDISGRFMEIASLTSPGGNMAPDALVELLRTITDYQKADGHYGRDIDWNIPISKNKGATPILWGNSRLLVGLLEAYQTFGQPKLLESARRLGDFYVSTADRLLDPAREEEYRATGTYASGYVTVYFPAIEGLVRLYKVTKDDRYLHQAERMAEFFKRFDKLPLRHSHGNLIAYHGLLMLYETMGKPEYLQRALNRWNEAVEGGYIWPIGGVGEGFDLRGNTDEGCSEADWLRLNLDLWRITGESRFLDAAERLIMNHYAMNRTPNGGYGHHNFTCDTIGPVLMQPKFKEAYWCCTFHGLVGMHTLKSYLVVGSERGVFINFPLDVSAPVSTGKEMWNVSVQREEDINGNVMCHVMIDPHGNTGKVPRVFLRQPDWAESVRAVDGSGREVKISREAGYLQLPVHSGAKGQVIVTFSFAPRMENRRFVRIAPEPKTVSRHRGVVLRNGPWILLANSNMNTKSLPVIVLYCDKLGRPVFPKAKDGVFRLITIDKFDATDDQIRQAGQSETKFTLTPWETIDHNAPMAFVFDVICVPSGFK